MTVRRGLLDIKNNMEEKKEKEYEANLHIATGPFSFMEVKVIDTALEIIKKNDYLLKHYESKQK